MKKIGVFCGGFSSEIEISLKSAETILKSFPKEYEAIKIMVKNQGWTATSGEKTGIFNLNTACVEFEKDIIQIDAALVYIHGNPGENGKIQAYLELFNVPCVNSGPLASSLSFDKWACNQFLKSFNIPVAKSIHLTRKSEYDKDVLIETLGLPIFVKPTDSGSSYGISKIKSIDTLDEGIAHAFKEGEQIVLEAFLKGIEVTCGVYYDGKTIEALPLTEIVSENEFFDFEAKYLGKSQEITPARISNTLKEKVQSTAVEVYRILGLKSIARVDFMLVDDTPYVIEVNTIPGFSNESIVPKMLKEAHISIEDFWRLIITNELEGHQSV